MEAFLKHSKDCVEKLSQFAEVHVVLGNEACDLDSMVSSLVYAFTIYKTLLSVPGRPTAVIPVFNVPREDFCLRTEAAFLFRRFHLDSSYFTFVEEVDLQNLLETNRLQLVLVDHNILAQRQKHMDVAVIEVLDHRKDQWPANLKVSKKIELVGSCSTLVAEKLLTMDVLDSQITGLLVGTILLDTVNLDPRAGRVTDKDKEIVEQLQGKYPVALDELYRSKTDRFHVVVLLFSNRSQKRSKSCAKFDVSGLSTLDLLRKDFKALPTHDNNLNVGISSISGLSLGEFYSRTQVQQSILEYCHSASLDVLVIMFLYFVKSLDDPPERQIAVCGPHEDARRKIAEHLSKSGELKLRQFSDCYQNCFVYDQENITASRKVVFPLVLEFIKSEF